MNCMIVGGKAECRQLLRSYIDRIPELCFAVETAGVAGADQLLMQHNIDLLFIDAEQAGTSILDFLKWQNPLPPTILMSYNKEHAADAYELDVVDFLCKPVSFERFGKAVQKVFGRQKEEAAEEHIYIKTESRIIKISCQDILFIEAMADYMMLHTATGKHIMHSTMKALEQKLPKSSFLRVHRSYIINLDNISQIKDQTVLVNSKSIPVGITYKEKLISRIPVI